MTPEPAMVCAPAASCSLVAFSRSSSAIFQYALNFAKTSSLFIARASSGRARRARIAGGGRGPLTREAAAHLRDLRAPFARRESTASSRVRASRLPSLRTAASEARCAMRGIDFLRSQL